MEDIEETPELNGSCSFFNPLIKNEYLQYMTRGKSNEGKLTFGRNPLVIYQELTDWLLKEKKKLEEDKPENLQNTTDFCAKIQNEMNGISKFTSSLPVIKMPDDHRKHSRKRKKISQSLNEEDKKFKCEVCAKEGRDQYFETGQGLGGHMSRVHKGKSDKFNKKKEIRNNREDFRKILQEAKIKMLRDRDLDYEYLMKSKEGKLKVKNFIKDNREKYRKLVRELRRNKRPSRIQN